MGWNRALPFERAVEEALRRAAFCNEHLTIRSECEWTSRGLAEDWMPGRQIDQARRDLQVGLNLRAALRRIWQRVILSQKPAHGWES